MDLKLEHSVVGLKLEMVHTPGQWITLVDRAEKWVRNSGPQSKDQWGISVTWVTVTVIHLNLACNGHLEYVRHWAKRAFIITITSFCR